MRLWHTKLLQTLPKQWLLGQHRECCALRGLGWNKKHSVIDYIKEYDFLMLYEYHLKVMYILIKKFHVFIDIKWYNFYYRGKRLGKVEKLPNEQKPYYKVYPEHNDDYLQECLSNLKAKGVVI
jgi:uncharacterized protein (TIGR02328 family)